MPDLSRPLEPGWTTTEWYMAAFAIILAVIVGSFVIIWIMRATYLRKIRELEKQLAGGRIYRHRWD